MCDLFILHITLSFSLSSDMSRLFYSPRNTGATDSLCVCVRVEKSVYFETKIRLNVRFRRESQITRASYVCCVWPILCTWFDTAAARGERGKMWLVERVCVCVVLYM